MYLRNNSSKRCSLFSKVFLLLTDFRTTVFMVHQRRVGIVIPFELLDVVSLFSQ